MLGGLTIGYILRLQIWNFV